MKMYTIQVHESLLKGGYFGSFEYHAHVLQFRTMLNGRNLCDKRSNCDMFIG